MLMLPLALRKQIEFVFISHVVRCWSTWQGQNYTNKKTLEKEVQGQTDMKVAATCAEPKARTFVWSSARKYRTKASKAYSMKTRTAQSTSQAFGEQINKHSDRQLLSFLRHASAILWNLSNVHIYIFAASKYEPFISCLQYVVDTIRYSDTHL